MSIRTLAEAAVLDYLDDGLEFCYIHEHEEADGFTQAEMEQAHHEALDILAGLRLKVAVV